MQQPSKLPQVLRVTELGGVNESASPSQLRPGEFSHLEGMFPLSDGLLARIPGRPLLATLPGNTNILHFAQTFNVNGDILVHTDSGRFAFTLDELLNRSSVPNLTPGTTPGNNDNEEAMSIAIMFQEETPGQNGGSLYGQLSGTDTTSLANTWRGRRLTSNPTNQASTVSSFTPSTGGTGAISTPGQFQLPVGTYRISAWLTFSGVGNPTYVQAALYNITTGAFQQNDGTGTAASYIVSSGQLTSGQAGFNFILQLEGRFVVSGAPNTFELRQSVNGVSGSNGNARDKNLCGTPKVTTGGSGFIAPIATATSPNEIYAMVKILKEP